MAAVQWHQWRRYLPNNQPTMAAVLELFWQRYNGINGSGTSPTIKQQWWRNQPTLASKAALQRRQ